MQPQALRPTQLGCSVSNWRGCLVEPLALSEWKRSTTFWHALPSGSQQCHCSDHHWLLWKPDKNHPNVSLNCSHIMPVGFDRAYCVHKLMMTLNKELPWAMGWTSLPVLRVIMYMKVVEWERVKQLSTTLLNSLYQGQTTLLNSLYQGQTTPLNLLCQGQTTPLNSLYQGQIWQWPCIKTCHVDRVWGCFLTCLHSVPLLNLRFIVQ